MEDIKKEMGEVMDGVKSFNKKADEIAAQVGEVKSSVNELNEWKVKKDEADKLNQKALDDLLAQKNRIELKPMEKKSLGQQIQEGIEENIDAFEKFARKEKKSFSFQLKAVADMGFGTHFGTADASVTAVRPGIIEQPKRKVHIRQLIPTGGSDDLNTYHFVTESGAGEGAIAPTAENATKPQIDFDFAEASVNFETIAGWMRVSRKMLKNVKGLTSFLNSRLPEKLLRVEDNLLLNGDGVSPNIKGIAVSGNFTAASGAATNDVEQLVQAISQLEELDREANGILIRPSDYYNILLNKASGSGEYNLPGIVTYVNGVLYVSGVPVFASTAATVDKFIVGDWRMGAQLLVSAPPVIEFFEQDGTNVRENKITVRIEETVAFPVFGNDYFIYGDFGNVA